MCEWKEYIIDEIVIDYYDYRGKTPKKLGLDWGGGDIKALSANNVEKGKINFNKECYLASEELYKIWMNKGDCEKGDVVMTMEAPLGNIAQIPDTSKYILSQRTLLFKTKKGFVNNDYLYYVLSDKAFQDELVKNSTGSTVVGIQQKKLAKLKVILPSLPVQYKIAQILSTADSVIEQTQAAIAKYIAIKQGLLHDLFTRGIDISTGKLRPKYEDAPELYKESKQGWIPKEWEAKELMNYLSFISYGFTNPMPETKDGPYLITAANVNYGKIQYETCRKTSQEAFDTLLTEKSRPKKNDILLTKDGTLGRIALVEKGNLCINQSVAVLRPNALINPLFLKILLESPSCQKTMLDEAGGSTIKHIYITIVDKMPIGVPQNIEEQKEIARRLEKMEMNIQTEQTYLLKLQMLKTGFMADLLSGKKRVKIVDPG